MFLLCVTRHRVGGRSTGREAAPVWSMDDVHRLPAPFGSPFLFWTMLNHAIWKRLFVRGESVSTLLDEMQVKRATPEHT